MPQSYMDKDAQLRAALVALAESHRVLVALLAQMFPGVPAPEETREPPKRAMRENKRAGIRLVLQILKDRGRRMSQSEIIEEMARRGVPVSESTCSRYLGYLKRKGKIDHVTSHGYGLAE